MRTSVRQVVTGVTTTLAVEISLALISASATRASTVMDTLVLVGKQAISVCVCVCVCLLLVLTSGTCVNTLFVPAALGHTALIRHQSFRNVLVYRH